MGYPSLKQSRSSEREEHRLNLISNIIVITRSLTWKCVRMSVGWRLSFLRVPRCYYYACSCHHSYLRIQRTMPCLKAPLTSCLWPITTEIYAFDPTGASALCPSKTLRTEHIDKRKWTKPPAYDLEIPIQSNKESTISLRYFTQIEAEGGACGVPFPDT